MIGRFQPIEERFLLSQKRTLYLVTCRLAQKICRSPCKLRPGEHLASERDATNLCSAAVYSAKAIQIGGSVLYLISQTNGKAHLRNPIIDFIIYLIC
jgi:hypothetical protein